MVLGWGSELTNAKSNGTATYRRDALHLLQRGLGRAGGRGDGRIVLHRVGRVNVELLPNERVAAVPDGLLAIAVALAAASALGRSSCALSDGGMASAPERGHAASTGDDGGCAS